MQAEVDRLRHAEQSVVKALQAASADAKQLSASELPKAREPGESAAISASGDQDFVATVKQIHALLSESIVAIAEAKVAAADDSSKRKS
jgi:hypothetical protein